MSQETIVMGATDGPTLTAAARASCIPTANRIVLPNNFFYIGRAFKVVMNGSQVFKHAVVRFMEVINEALAANDMKKDDIDLLIPHQANLRISQFIQQKLALPDAKVYNNIMRYGNTTAASIPIAMSEAWAEGRIKEGDLICLAAFGSGFTWASALIRW